MRLGWTCSVSRIVQRRLDTRHAAARVFPDGDPMMEGDGKADSKVHVYMLLLEVRLGGVSCWCFEEETCGDFRDP